MWSSGIILYALLVVSLYYFFFFYLSDRLGLRVAIRAIRVEIEPTNVFIPPSIRYLAAVTATTVPPRCHRESISIVNSPINGNGLAGCCLSLHCLHRATTTSSNSAIQQKLVGSSYVTLWDLTISVPGGILYDVCN